MVRRMSCRCSVCRKSFLPDARVGSRQKTCSPGCSRERHRRQCAKWNRQHRHLRRGAQLKQRLEQARSAEKERETGTESRRQRPSRRFLDLPKQEMQEEIGMEMVVIIKFIFQILAKERIRGDPATKCLKSAS